MTLTLHLPTALYLGLLAAVLGLLILLHLLQRRRVRRVVSTLRVFRRLQAQSVDAPARRRLLSPHLLLQMAAAFLLLSAAAGPRFQCAAAWRERVVIVLHNDTGMTARLQDGRTRWEAAIAGARTELGRLRAGDEAAVLATTPEAGGQQALTPDLSVARDALDALVPHHLPGRPQQALAKALALLGDAPGRVVYFGDTAPAEPHARLEWRPVGDEAANAGIVAFDLQPDEPGRAFCALLNPGQAPVSGRLHVETITDDGAAEALMAPQEVRLAGGRRLPLVLSADWASAPVVQVRLEAPDDALTADDAVWAVQGPLRSRVAVVGDAPPELLRALEAEGASDVTRIADPGAVPPSADLIVYCGIMPQQLPPRPVLLVQPPGAVGPLMPGSGRARGEHLTLANAAEADALLARLEGLPVGELPRFQLIGPAQVLARSRREGLPAIVRWRDEGAGRTRPRWAVLFELGTANTPWPRRASFPVFFAAILRELRTGSGGWQYLTTGTPAASAHVSPGALLSGPRQRTITGAQPLPLSGLYRVADPRPHEPARVAANLLDPGQSDITPSPPPADRPAPTADTAVRGGVRRRPLQTPLLLLGLLTVFAEWQYTRRQSAR